VFSIIWGICFSLKANPNGMKTSDSGTVLAQGTRLLSADASKAGAPAAFWHSSDVLMPQLSIVGLS
jgi:hypothetical protein